MDEKDLKKKNIIFFDGLCHLCDGFIDIIIRLDSGHIYTFSPLQGETAAKLLKPEQMLNLNSILFYQNGLVSYRSKAVLKIIQGLGGVYRLVFVLKVLPSPVLDLFYNFIAQNRYSFFGKKESCRIPTESEKKYLLP